MDAQDATTRTVTTTELVGYKLVDKDRNSMVWKSHKVHYDVGSTYSVVDADKVRLCHYGLHFCPRALDCLEFYGFTNGNRLLRVVVPVGATVVASRDGVKCAASALHIDADVTDDAATLLTGVLVVRDADEIITDCYRNGMLHRDTRDEPARVYRTPRCIEKIWNRNGEPYEGCGPYVAVRLRPGLDDGPRAARQDGIYISVGPSEKENLARILARIEPFETLGV
jgi:hypothetical protein